MADFSSTVELIFRGTNLLGNTVNSVVNDIDRMNRSVVNAVAPVGALTVGFVALEVAAARLAIQFTGSAIDAALDFAAAQTEVRQVTGATLDEINRFEPEITELSRLYNVASSEILQGTADFARAGFNLSDALQAAEIGIRGATAGQVEFDLVTTGLRSSLAGFGIEATNSGQALDAMERILNIVNFSAQNANVNFDELLQAFARLSPIASQAGFDFEKTAAAATAVTAVFQQGEIGARALGSILGSLVSDNTRVIDTLDDLGISQRDVNGEFKSGFQIFDELVPKLNELSEAERVRVALAIAGKDQFGKLLAVTESYEKELAKLADTEAVYSSVQSEVNLVLATAGQRIQGLSQDYGELQKTIGSKILPAVADTSDAFGFLLNTLQDLITAGALDEFFDAFQPSLVELQRLAREAAAALPDALANADFSGFSDGLESLFGDLANVSISSESLAEVITGLGDTFRSAAEFTDSLLSILGGVATVVAPIISVFSDLNSATDGWLGTIGGAAIAIGLFGGAITGIVALLKSTIGLFGSLGNAGVLLDGALKSGAASGNVFKIALSGIGGALAFLTGPIGLALLVFQLGQLVSQSDVVKSAITGAFDGAVDFIDRYIIDIKDAEDTSAELGQTVQNVGGELVALGNNTRKAANDLGGFGQELENLIFDTDSAAQDIAELDALINSLAPGDVERLDIEVPPEQVESLIGAIRIVDEAGNVVKTVYETMASDVAKSAQSQAESVDEVIKKTEEFELRLLEIQSNERIKIIEATVELNVAQLEADAKQIQAAFSSIDNTVSSTGDLIGNLFSSLSDFGRFDQLRVFDQIEKENARRQVSLDLQARLIEAQIDKLRAQTRALAKGQAFFHIDASPLKPHLQAILHEMISQTQIEASADGLELLLNINPPVADAA